VSPHRSDLWTSEQEAQLLKLAATAPRIVDVADAMDKTRNSIVGKLARMRRNGQVGEIEWSLRPNRYKALKRSPGPRMPPHQPPPKPRRGLPPPREPMQPEPTPEIFTMRRLALLELGPRTCRWPVGDVGEPTFCFCGNETDRDRVYCTVHHVVAYYRGNR